MQPLVTRAEEIEPVGKETFRELWVSELEWRERAIEEANEIIRGDA